MRLWNVSKDEKRSEQLWRHAMETLSVLPVLCEGNPPITGGFPSQRAVSADSYVFFDVSLNK